MNITRQTIIRANRFGTEFRDFVRGIIAHNSNTTEMQILGCIAANEMGVTIGPSNNAIQIATQKTCEKWARKKWGSKNTRPKNWQLKFTAHINATIINFLESYQGEFIDFVVGYSDLMNRQEIPTAHREALELLDYFLCDISDHVRY